MAGNLSKGLCTVTILSITIVALAGSCNHPHSNPERATDSKRTTAASNQVSSAMIGRQITVRGKLLPDKIGWYIALDNQQGVYFSPERSYSEMEGKLVTATGILRFFECPKNPLTDEKGRVVNKKGQVIDRCSDHFYFEAESDQVQLLPDGNK